MELRQRAADPPHIPHRYRDAQVAEVKAREMEITMGEVESQCGRAGGRAGEHEGLTCCSLYNTTTFEWSFLKDLLFLSYFFPSAF